MSAAKSLYRELVGFGFSVSAEGDTLLVAPSSRLTDELRRRIRLEKESLLVLLGDSAPPPLTEGEREDLQEALDERAAIHEFDGGLPRPDAEAEAARRMRVFRVRVAMREGEPDRWAMMLAPGCDLPEARASAERQFGAERVLDIKPICEPLPPRQ